ncbi:MAG: class I SAM-dependent methyltransferase [Actinomycetota bacterium]|nr:class I SAM-dependent methyltransferase [Actinomycetota bacterium]
MITFDFDRLGDLSGALVLDLGAGGGRHSIAALARGAQVISFEISLDLLLEIEDAIAGAEEYLDLEEGTLSKRASSILGDGRFLPFANDSFDVVLVSEVLEHIYEDRMVMAEVRRVLKPNGVAACSVPRYFGEVINWAISKEYHSAAGGHIRIYRSTQLKERLKAAGLKSVSASYHHGLHSPYWWLKSLLGIEDNNRKIVAKYHSKLVEVMMGERPKLEEIEAKYLNPIMGKSFSVYLKRDDTDARR